MGEYNGKDHGVFSFFCGGDFVIYIYFRSFGDCGADDPEGAKKWTVEAGAMFLWYWAVFGCGGVILLVCD